MTQIMYVSNSKQGNSLQLSITFTTTWNKSNELQFSTEWFATELSVKDRKN